MEVHDSPAVGDRCDFGYHWPILQLIHNTRRPLFSPHNSSRTQTVSMLITGLYFSYATTNEHFEAHH